MINWQNQELGTPQIMQGERERERDRQTERERQTHRERETDRQRAKKRKKKETTLKTINSNTQIVHNFFPSVPKHSGKEKSMHILHLFSLSLAAR